MKKALILNNKVVDVVNNEFEVSSSFTWMDCPDDCVAYRWSIIDEVLQENPIPADTRTVSQKRREAYPHLLDYIDGVVKSDQAQINKYIADCMAVKARYPKGG